MKRPPIIALLAILSALPLSAQQSFTPYPTPDVQFVADPLQAPSLTASYSGAPGQVNVWYWVVASYVRGQSGASSPVSLQIFDNPTALNPVVLSWNSTGALTYSVIRSNTAGYSSSCLACLVGTVSGTTLTDSGGALSAFTHSPIARASGSIRFNNQGYPASRFTFQPPRLAAFANEPVTFAELPGGVEAGTQVYCSNCSGTSPCTAAGAGSLAVRDSAGWNCGSSAAGGGLTVNGAGSITNLSNTTPVPPANSVNLDWQAAGADASANLLFSDVGTATFGSGGAFSWTFNSNANHAQLLFNVSSMFLMHGTAGAETARFEFTGANFLGAVTGSPGLTSAAGSVGTPAFSFRGNANTGLYRIGADNMGVATGGLPAGQWSAAQQYITTNMGVEFTESDTNPPCAAGNYTIYSDLSETVLKKCQDGVLTDLDTGGADADTIEFELMNALFPLTDPATLDFPVSSGGPKFPQILFDDPAAGAPDEVVQYQKTLPIWWATANLRIDYKMDTPIADNVLLQVQVACLTPSDAQDLDAKGWDETTTGEQTVPPTAGFVSRLTIGLTAANCAAGDWMAVALTRQESVSDAGGQLQMVGLSIAE